MTRNEARAKHVIWFRQDLRLFDNKALAAACENPDSEVHAVYTAPLSQWAAHDVSPRQIAFIHEHLKRLAQDLALLGIPLVCHVCKSYRDAAQWVATYCREHEIDALYFNNQYELNELRRDRYLAENLPENTTLTRFDDCLLLPPGSVRNQQGEMYKVFTPFKQAFLKGLHQQDFACLSKPAKRTEHAESRQEASLPTDFFPHQPTPPDPLCPVGEKAAIGRLRDFCQHKVEHYLNDRDKPSVEGTSRLAAYLTIGVLSPRQCLNRLLAEAPDAFWQSNSGASTWFSELIWREFYHHLIVAFPHLCRYKPFIDWTDHIDWNPSETDFLAWQEGKTGYPIVDAAMRQLNQTGWMHNRLRMITASFLVKDLLIDWRKGERYFMSTLTDGNLAANNGGWQWSASTGTDASPWFRIFNPTTQGKKFDPEGTFVRKWLPELTAVPDEFIHTPHTWAEKNNRFLDYPKPIVLHEKARVKTLEAFKKARQHVDDAP